IDGAMLFQSLPQNVLLGSGEPLPTNSVVVRVGLLLLQFPTLGFHITLKSDPEHPKSADWPPVKRPPSPVVSYGTPYLSNRIPRFKVRLFRTFHVSLKNRSQSFS